MNRPLALFAFLLVCAPVSGRASFAGESSEPTHATASATRSEGLSLAVAQLRADCSAREAYVRSCSVEEIAGSTYTRGPLVLRRVQAEFFGSRERFVRSEVQTAALAGLGSLGSLPKDLASDVRAARPTSIAIADGNVQLEIGRRVEWDSWSGILKNKTDPAMRAGSLNTSGLMYAEDWFSRQLDRFELQRVDNDARDADRRIWIFTERFTDTTSDVHVLVTSDSQRNLVVRHLWQRISNARLESALSAYTPGVPLTWTREGKLREWVVEATVTKGGWSLPSKARCNSTVAWFSYQPRPEWARVDSARFDPRMAPAETAGCDLAVIDEASLAPVAYTKRPAGS